MNNNEILHRSSVNTNNVETQDSQTISSQQVALNDIAVNEPQASQDGVGLLFTSLGILGIGLIAILKLKSSKERKPFNFSLPLFKYHPQFPCTKCRFFNKKSDKKCVVHPYKVLIIQAKNCSDYWARDSKTFFQ
ncbi:MAG: hypothetical protein RIM23_21115 [Coleofasciculus sp. G3-WIS-01]|uniref:hypothetical protein n=1 Tax=Coleofasciculus sp. G3-WIS-01 TaxID=3069528 RepID=UPI0032F262F3